MIQAINNRDYAEVAVAAGYLTLTTNRRLNSSERLKHIKGFINALGSVSRTATSSHEEIRNLHILFLIVVENLVFRIEYFGLPEVSECVIQACRELHLSLSHNSMSDSLTRIWLVIDIRLLQALCCGYHCTAAPYGQRHEQFTALLSTVATQFWQGAFTAFFGHPDCQALLQYLEIYDTSVCGGPQAKAECFYPPPPPIRGSVSDWMCMLQYVCATQMMYCALLDISDDLHPPNLSLVEAAWIIARVCEYFKHNLSSRMVCSHALLRVAASSLVRFQNSSGTLNRMSWFRSFPTEMSHPSSWSWLLSVVGDSRRRDSCSILNLHSSMIMFNFWMPFAWSWCLEKEFGEL